MSSWANCAVGLVRTYTSTPSLGTLITPAIRKDAQSNTLAGMATVAEPVLAQNKVSSN